MPDTNIKEGVNMSRKKSWKDKLNDDKDFPKVVKLEGKLASKWGEGTMVIPRPRDVDLIMKMVPRGKLITVSQIREILARFYNTTIACPLTTGIFSKIAAFAAEEERKGGKRDVTPYWRTIKNDGSIDKKFPISDVEIAEILNSEGITVIRKGKKMKVKDFQNFLIDIDEIYNHFSELKESNI